MIFTSAEGTDVLALAAGADRGSAVELITDLPVAGCHPLTRLVLDKEGFGLATARRGMAGLPAEEAERGTAVERTPVCGIAVRAKSLGRL